MMLRCILAAVLPAIGSAQAEASAFEPRLAFIRWIDQFVPYATAGRENASGPLGAAGQMPICTELMKDHYAPNATLTAMAGGKVTGVFPPSMLPTADCQFFGSVRHNPNNRGLKAVVKVEHCKGVWRGSFPPFASGRGNALGANASILETMERSFVIWGKIDDIGRFQATKDITCFGPCIGLEGVNYTWDCPAQTDTPKPYDTDAERNAAFTRWINEFVPYSKAPKENPLGPLGAAGQMPICAELMKDHYAPTATLTAMAGPMVTGVFAPAMLPVADCQFFGSVMHDPKKKGTMAVNSVENCDGVWRGSFPPFRNGSNNALRANATVLETMERGFAINGKLDEIGRFQATKDITCFGPCVGLEGKNYTWDCGKMDTCIQVKKEYQKQGCCGSPMKTFKIANKTAAGKRRLSSKDELFQKVHEALNEAKIQGGASQASGLATELIDMAEKYAKTMS